MGRIPKIDSTSNTLTKIDAKTSPLGYKPKLVSDKRVNRADIERFAIEVSGYTVYAWSKLANKDRNNFRKLAVDLLNEDYTDG